MKLKDKVALVTGTSPNIGGGISLAVKICKPPRFPKQSDVIAMKVDGIGRLSNPVQ
jgi:2-keto-4-pentenoate hydratase/2-oxohepta-3-ene-1,7-dioic acid hydratase in catechol pathway